MHPESDRMSQKQKSMIGGVSVLAFAGIVCKMVGVLFRIPLANYIGGEGLGIYQKVFPAYSLLLTVSSAGIPVAISRMVSHYTTNNDPFNARRIFRVALIVLTVLGLISTLFLMLFSSWLSLRVGTADAKTGYLAIAPSLFFVCVMSAFRGYMQGHRLMAPTAVSQLIEQVGKVGIALPLAYAGMARGGVALGAAGALAGTSIAEMAALLYMALKHVASRKAFASFPQSPAQPVSEKLIAKRLISISIPITLGACIVPLASLIDSFMITNLMEASGFEAGDALVRYGLYSGMVIALINVPTALAQAVSTNLVPTIASGSAKGDHAYVAKESLTGLRMASVIGLPCSVGMSILAKPLMFLLYSGKDTAEQLTAAASLLEISACTIVLFTMVQATSGILQGLGKQRIPMYTLMAGVVCKIALNFTLIRIPSVNISGAPIASLVCYTVSMIPNLYYVRKFAGCRMELDSLLLRPLAASAVMGAAVYALRRFVFKGIAIGARQELLLAVSVCTAAGFILYLLAAVWFKAIRREELPRFLRGRKH